MTPAAAFTRAIAHVVLGVLGVLAGTALAAVWPWSTEVRRHWYHTLSFLRPEECSRCRQEYAVARYCRELRTWRLR